MPIELYIVLAVVVLVASVFALRRRATPKSIETPRTDALPPAAATPDDAPRREPARIREPREAPAAPQRPAPAMPAERPSADPGGEAQRHRDREDDRERIRRGLEKTRGGFVAKLARISAASRRSMERCATRSKKCCSPRTSAPSLRRR